MRATVGYHASAVYHRKKREEDRLLDGLTRPGRVRVLKGFVFRQRKPAVFGVEVDKGTIKPGYKLVNKANGEELGEIREVQSQGDNVQKAETGERVALSMNDVTIGKNVSEGDVLELDAI